MSATRTLGRVRVALGVLSGGAVRTLLVIGLAALLAIGFLAVLFTQIASEARSTEEFRRRMDWSIETRGLLRMTFSALQDAETGERGYILTGNPEFLQPHAAAVQKLPGLLKQLLTLTADTPEHLQALELEELSHAQLATLSDAITTRERFGAVVAMEIVNSKQGKQRMDQIRALVERMIAHENREIETASAAVRHQTARFEAIALGLILASGLVLIAASAGAILYAAHRRRSELELAQARHIAEEAARAKTDFLASMSHEIRTPLNGIVGYTERLGAEALTPEQRRYVERIDVASSALLTIVNDILDLSQIEAGRLSLEVNPFSLEALIDNTVSIVGSIAAKKGLPLRVILDPKLPKLLLGDEARLRQVLLNLLNNAIKFTHEGQITLDIQSEGRSHELEMLRFSVTDTGIGIPADKRERLFRRFSQVDNTIRRQFGGSGLGLAISKRLIEFMGGQIGAESEEGRGSTFWVSVALPQAEAATAERRNENVEPAATSAKILVAEDLEINQELTRSILETAGYQVEVVADGIEAIAAIQAGNYDLVFMDIQMPRMDGIAATKEIRALDHPMSKVPIIAMTANVLPQQVRSFKEVGMNDHIGKPMKRNDLLIKISQWLPKARTVETSGAEASAPCAVFDQQAFHELRNMMGHDRVAAWLAQLKEQLSSVLSEDKLDAANRQPLGKSAHDVVSQAALLGFIELSQRCRELEEACKGASNLALVFERARSAALTAREKIDTL